MGDVSVFNCEKSPRNDYISQKSFDHFFESINQVNLNGISTMQALWVWFGDFKMEPLPTSTYFCPSLSGGINPQFQATNFEHLKSMWHCFHYPTLSLIINCQNHQHMNTQVVESVIRVRIRQPLDKNASVGPSIMIDCKKQPPMPTYLGIHSAHRPSPKNPKVLTQKYLLLLISSSKVH